VAGRVDILGGGAIPRVLRPFARRMERGQRVRLIERQELALARLAHQFRAVRRAPAQERAERRLDRRPRVE
jgi:hypothetical protein